MSRAGPPAVVALVLVVAWLATGVHPDEAARYLAYELVYVLGPGVVLYRLLVRAPGSPLVQAAVGWALGYAAEVLVFSGLAALDARRAFLVWPLVVVGLGLLGRALRRPHGDREHDEDWPRSAVTIAAAVVALGVLYLTLGYFLEAPLPRSGEPVSYDVDNVFTLSLTAEVTHHWPVTTPSVAGEPLRYYVFAFVHIAAANEVMGLDLSVQALRLFPAMLLVVAALTMLAAARTVTRSPWAAVLATGLMLLAGKIDMDPTKIATSVPTLFPRSHTFLFAVPLFLALVTVVVREVLSRPRPPAGGVVALIAIFMAAAAGTKSMAAAVVLGGLSVYCAWALARHRDALLPAAVVAGVATLVTGAIYVLFIGGDTAGLFEVEPSLPDLSLYAVLIGVVWLPRANLTGDHATVLLLGLLVAGVGVAQLLHAPGASQNWFAFYGLLAGMILSAHGMVTRWSTLDSATRRQLALAAAVLLGGVMAVAVGVFTARSSRAGTAWELATYGSAGAGAIVLALWLRWRAGLAPAAALTTFVLVLSAGEVPVKTASEIVGDVRNDRPLYTPDSPGNQGLTPGMFTGLRWLRDHSRPDDLIAVNTHYVSVSARDARFFYVTAFAERRAYLEAWAYTPRAERLAPDLRTRELPFPARSALNDAAFTPGPGQAAAVAGLRRAGVRFLVVDLVHGGAAVTAAIPGAERVFDNAALGIYRL